MSNGDNGGNANGNLPQQSPAYVMDEVKLLLGDVTTPETEVEFSTASRATPATIRDNINPPWSWENAAARNAQQVTADEIGKIGYETDTDTYYQLTGANPANWQEVPNPSNTSSPFELSTGASDADSYHDFFRLQIAFEDVWAEMTDHRIKSLSEQLFATWDAIMKESGDYKGLARYVAPDDEIAGVDQLQNFIANLKFVLGLSNDSAVPPNFSNEINQLRSLIDKILSGCNMLLGTVNWAGTGGWQNGILFQNQNFALNADPNSGNPWGNDLAQINNAYPGVARSQVFDFIRNDLNSIPSTQQSAQDTQVPDLARLITALDAMLHEPYRFDVFATGSINYGLLLNYRQHWKPQSYQVGNLVSTIPLAPQETRRYTTKSVVKKTRNVKEIDDSLRAGKDESSNTWRVDAEVVDRAKNQTNFQKNASGSYGNDDTYKVSAGMQQGHDQAVESAQTKRDFHEAVVKSAQEYRNEHRTEISTEETREDESTSYREIRNPNDELTVTYLFYELQRRYLVDESLHKVTPVIMVANEVPAPHEIDQSWILRSDWIIKRTILDDSFLPALEYLSTDYTGEQVKLQVLWMAVEQQKGIVDKIGQQVQLANASLQTATLGLQSAQDTSIQDQQKAEMQTLVKSFFDPLGIGQVGAPGDGNADRARVDFAKDALNRAQAKVDQLTSDLKSETTAMQVAVDKYTAASTKHFEMLADIDRLRVHVKDNIIYYMQAIWTYEPPDQRYFRLYNLDVPVFDHNTTVNFSSKTGVAAGLEQIDTTHTPISILFPPPTLTNEPTKLHQVADLENLIGFKGNYMIFPMTAFNYMNWFMMQDYIHIDTTTGVTAQDPDPNATKTPAELQAAMDAIRQNAQGGFAANQELFQEIVIRLISNQNPEMVIVPSDSLYIEALPGTHPLLEDFKLIHRAIDIKKAQAEVRHAELENLRLAARLANADYGDPEVEKKIIVEAGASKHLTVQADGN